jgi:hypothetical protein
VLCYGEGQEDSNLRPLDPENDRDPIYIVDINDNTATIKRARAIFEPFLCQLESKIPAASCSVRC